VTCSRESVPTAVCAPHVRRVLRKRPKGPSLPRKQQATSPQRTRYWPIQSYGVIGNNRTALLVSPEGSIDWAPFPQFDSMPVFFGLLDSRRGGAFALRPTDPIVEARSAYRAGTNVLARRFRTRNGGEVRFVDFCPESDSDALLMSEIHRQVSVTRGTVGIEVIYAPRFDYGRHATELQPTRHGVFASDRKEVATLSTHQKLKIDPSRRGAFARFSMRTGEKECFVFCHGADAVHPVEAFESSRRLAQTTRYWRSWSALSTYRGRWRSAVHRSALVLRLMAYRPTGAMVAAPTTSLPEWIGGERNWDYRFAWIRDTALALRAFSRLGYSREATRFTYWLLSALEHDGSRLRVFYTVDGRPPPVERVLHRLAGYRNSRPVRIGNAAHDQSQHDVFQGIVTIVELLERHGEIVPADLWTQVRKIVQRAADTWRRADNGIWEIRKPLRHYVYSKATSWSALTRGADLGERLGFDGPFDEWRQQASEIREDVLTRGLTSDGASLGWHYGSIGPDASLLRLVELGFLGPGDPLMRSTARRIESDLAHGPFLYRYLENDGHPPNEGFFLACSFWRIEYLTVAGELSRARKLLEGILDHAGPHGLFAEEIAPDGNHLGNFPQALSHLALISAATALDMALDSAAGSVRPEFIRGAPASPTETPLRRSTRSDRR
jgi:alpha,alpha-trehalase